MPDLANFHITRHPNKTFSKHQASSRGVLLYAHSKGDDGLIGQLKDLAENCKVDELLDLSKQSIQAGVQLFSETETYLNSEIERWDEQEAAHDLRASLAIRSAISVKQFEIEELETEISELDPQKDKAEIAGYKKQIDELQKELEELRGELTSVLQERQVAKSFPHTFLECLSFAKEAAEYICQVCDDRSSARRAERFLRKNIERIRHCGAAPSLGAARVNLFTTIRYIAAGTLISLKLHKLSTDPRYPDFRCLIKALDVLSALAKQDADKLEIDTKAICREVSKPVIFPDWALNFSPCDCAKKGVDPEGRELLSHPEQMQASIEEYQGKLAEVERCRDNEKCDCTECEGCECDECCVPQNPCCIELHSYVTDLMTIRQTLKCYRPGELAHIQNVMAGEKLSRTHESLRETEDYTEEETTTRREEEHNHQTSERFEEQEAVQKTIDQDFAADAGITTSGKYGPPANRTQVNTNASVSYSRSQSEAKQSARNFAKDVVQRSVLKLQEETRKLSSRRVLRRITETNTHSFEAVDQGHVIGQYHWVNKVSSAQVMNWGKRMMYDFVIPEPQKLYQHLLQKKRNNQKGLTEGEAYPPIDFKTDDIQPVDDPNAPSANFYAAICERYEIENPPPPPALELTLPFSFHDTTNEEIDEYGKSFLFGTVPVPEGYTATSVSAYGNGYEAKNDNGAHMIVAGHLKSIHRTLGTISGLDVEGSTTLEIVGFAKGVKAYHVAGRVECTVNPDSLLSWKQTIMGMIRERIEPRDESEDFEPLVQIRGRNPFFNRETEKTELWRLVVSMISCQHFDRFGAMKHKVEPCGHPQLDFQQAQDEGVFIQFFEQVFEKEQMMYLFYPYFWGSKCDWADKIETDSGDALFDKFLSCGAARVSIPVRQGFEVQALHYEQHGEIWLGNGQPDYDPSSPHYLAMHDEFRSQSGDFAQERQGLVDFDYEDDQENSVTLDDTQISIHGTDQWWDWNGTSDPLFPSDWGDENDVAIQDDIDREIFINRKSYRIVDIELYRGNDVNGTPWVPSSAADDNANFIRNMRWIMTLERAVERPEPDDPQNPPKLQNMKYSTGAIFVGAEWEIETPTSLVWLRPGGSSGYDSCLPCYPIEC